MWTRAGWSACWRALRHPRVTQGALLNHNDRLADRTDGERGDSQSAPRQDREAIGRSRGGLTTKIHLLADLRSRPLAAVVTAGQRGDTLAFAPLLARLRIARGGPGRPRTRPGRLLGDRAYSSRAIRSQLRRRKVRTVVPEPVDQQAHRRRRGPAGGRPPSFDRDAYRLRNTTERCVNKLKTHRAVAMRTDKRAWIYDGTIAVASTRIWLRDLTRHPSDRA